MAGKRMSARRTLTDDKTNQNDAAPASRLPSLRPPPTLTERARAMWTLKVCRYRPKANPDSRCVGVLFALVRRGLQPSVA